MTSDLSTANIRKTNLKIFLVMMAGMFMALVLIRIFFFTMNASKGTFLGRVTEAREYLPQIAQEEEDIVMVFGSSMVDAGFSARQFDREVKELGVDNIKSYNFGFGGLNPYFQDYLSRRIGEELGKQDKQLKLAVIEFNPFQTTKARWNGAIPIIDSFTTLLASPAELWEITKEDPARGVLMAEIYYLRDGVSAQMATSFFGRPFRGDRERSETPVNEELQKQLEEVGSKLGEAFRTEYPDFDGCDWCIDWQGAGTIPEERSEETLALFVPYYESLRSQRRMENDRFNRIFCCDIEGLDFEETLVEAFIRVVNNFQGFSEQVEVILLPRNTEWIKYSDEAQQRLDAVLERIARETGVSIRNYQLEPRFTPEMFSDTTHFARYSGDVEFTTMLVEEFVDQLR